VRPDPYFPDAGVLFGREAARRFWEDQREFMGHGHLEIVEQHDLGDRCLIRVHQHVDAPASGVRSSYDWSFLTTVRAGRTVMIEFFLDRDRGLAAAGLSGGES
jgi:ketosteroid isomerase-like protein